MTEGPLCPACGAADVVVFHRQEGVPVNSCLLLETREEATSFPRGRIDLGHCRSCGFLTNVAFDPALAEYSARYEETQGFSARFNSFARDLAKRWVEDYDLHGQSVLEIGCGKGDFLVMMAEAGIGHGVGIDPSVHPERITSEAGHRVSWIPDFFTEKYAHLPADALVCRHTLEHISPVSEFMTMVRRAIGDRTRTVVLFQLPDAFRVLDEIAFWDVYYEHCSYFTMGSLARLFRSNGFEVLDLSLDYDDQYIVLAASPSSIPATGQPLAIEDDLDEIATGVHRFQAGFARNVDEWSEQVRAVTDRGGKAVIWGAGSKGVAYLSALQTPGIEYAVDINPHKHGMFMAGSGQQIVAPEHLQTYRPDLVVVMNPIYLSEIRSSLDELGVSAELIAV